jgi:hypothetical protein
MKNTSKKEVEKVQFFADNVRDFVVF